jgi:hypothetical protein
LMEWLAFTPATLPDGGRTEEWDCGVVAGQKRAAEKLMRWQFGKKQTRRLPGYPRNGC